MMIDSDRNSAAKMAGVAEEDVYDVLIMGGGVAGLGLAMHILQRLPAAKVAVVDPNTRQRVDYKRDFKIGESTVFTSATFFARELGMNDYMIDQMPPKHGLFYHFPRVITKTDTFDDYFSLAAFKPPDVPTFQVNRAKLEADMLIFAEKLGAKFIYGHCKNLDLTPGDQLNSVDCVVKPEPSAQAIEQLATRSSRAIDWKSDEALNDESEWNPPLTSEDGQKPVIRKLYARHLVDAAGRRFLIGTKKNVIEKNPANLFGVDNASVWVRARNCNYDFFTNGQTAQRTLTSWLYATNHYCGHGHWLWVIPIETRGTRDISIGVAFDKTVFKLSQFNSPAKFMAFLKKNHMLLYNTIASGEIVDFQMYPRLAHRSSIISSPDNWYLLGDAAFNVDPWYSNGMVAIAFQCTIWSTFIRSKLLKLPEAESLRQPYNDFCVSQIKGLNHLICKLHLQQGNASAISWRLAFETALGQLSSLQFQARLFLCPLFISRYLSLEPSRLGFLQDIYDLLDEVVMDHKNIGFVDYNIPGNNCIKYGPFCRFNSQHFLVMDEFTEHGATSFKRVKASKAFCICCVWMAHLLTIFVYRGWGWNGFLRPKVLGMYMYLALRTLVAIVGWIADFVTNRNIIMNPWQHNREQAFKHYKPETAAVPW